MVRLRLDLDRGANAELERAEAARGGMGWVRGETVCMSSTFWDSYSKRTSRFGFERAWRFAFVHAPALQDFGDMLTKRTRNRIQSRDGKRICACWCIALVVRVCVNLSVRDSVDL